MSLAHSPSIVTNGLILCLDAGNIKSYPGSGMTWYDLSLSQNHGAFPASTVVSASSINFNKASLQSQSASFSQNYNAGTTGSFTISIWVKPNGVCTTYTGETGALNLGGLFGNAFFGNGTGFGLGYYKNTTYTPNDVFYFQIRNDPAGGYINNYYGAGDLNQWSCICGVFNRGVTADLYINGVLVNSLEAATFGSKSLTPTVGLAIGRSNITPYYYKGGEYGYAKLYSRALSADEVKQNFNALKGRYGL